MRRDSAPRDRQLRSAAPCMMRRAISNIRRLSRSHGSGNHAVRVSERHSVHPAAGSEHPGHDLLRGRAVVAAGRGAIPRALFPPDRHVDLRALRRARSLLDPADPRLSPAPLRGVARGRPRLPRLAGSDDSVPRPPGRRGGGGRDRDRPGCARSDPARRRARPRARGLRGGRRQRLAVRGGDVRGAQHGRGARRRGARRLPHWPARAPAPLTADPSGARGRRGPGRGHGTSARACCRLGLAGLGGHGAVVCPGGHCHRGTHRRAAHRAPREPDRGRLPAQRGVRAARARDRDHDRAGDRRGIVLRPLPRLHWGRSSHP